MKKRITAFLLTLTLIFIFPLSLFACGKKSSLLRINEVTHSVFYAPLYLAEALGYFDDEGITIELTNGGGADSTMSAVLSGSADVGFCGPEAAIYVAIGNSSDTPKVFGQLTKRDGSFLVSRQKYDNFDWQYLNGKEILAGRKGGVPAMTFEYTLKNLAVSATLNYDVSFNLMTSAFESGIADFCTMFEPTASQYQAAGKGYIVASVGQQSGEIPYTCFIAKQSYIDQNGDKIDGLLRAVTRAIKYVNESDSGEIAQKLAPYFDGTDTDALKTSVENYRAIDAWVTNMAMKEESFERLQDIIESAGELEKRVNFSDLVICDRADAIYKEIYL